MRFFLYLVYISWGHKLWHCVWIENILFHNQGLYSLSGKTSCRQISWSLEAARLDVIMIISLWNLTVCLSHFRATAKIVQRLSRGFETSRDLAVRRPPAKRIEAQFIIVRPGVGVGWAGAPQLRVFFVFSWCCQFVDGVSTVANLQYNLFYELDDVSTLRSRHTRQTTQQSEIYCYAFDPRKKGCHENSFGEFAKLNPTNQPLAWHLRK